MKINLLRQKILDLAIRGKLVPQDPNDEPASVLLERIRAEKERLIAEGKIKRPKKSNASSAPSHYRQFEPPFPIPKSWEWVRLEDIAECIVDCPHTTAKDEGHGFALIRTPNVGEGELILRGVHRVSESIYNLRNRRAQPTEGDIIYAREAPAGNAAVVRQEKVCLGQRTVLIKPLKEFCNSEYITFALLAPLSKNRLISKATGSTVQHVNLEDIRPFYIPLPPFEEQVRIVVKLKILLGLLTEASSGLDSLSLLIKSCKYRILDLAMQGKLVPQDPADEPAADMLYRINSKAKIISDNPHYPQLPRNWVYISILDVNTYKSSNVTPSSMPDQFFDLYSVPIFSTIKPENIQGSEIGSAKQVIKKGDVLLCKINPHINRVWEITENSDRVQIASSEWIVIRSEIHQSTFLKWYFNSPKFRTLLSSQVSGVGGSLTRAQPTIVKNYLVPVPPKEEQIRISRAIKEWFECLDKISLSLSN